MIFHWYLISEKKNSHHREKFSAYRTKNSIIDRSNENNNNNKKPKTVVLTFSTVLFVIFFDLIFVLCVCWKFERKTEDGACTKVISNGNAMGHWVNNFCEKRSVRCWNCQRCCYVCVSKANEKECSSYNTKIIVPMLMHARKSFASGIDGIN